MVTLSRVIYVAKWPVVLLVIDGEVDQYMNRWQSISICCGLQTRDKPKRIVPEDYLHWQVVIYLGTYLFSTSPVDEDLGRVIKLTAHQFHPQVIASFGRLTHSRK